jgi:predicted dehydrogenase
MFSVAVVGAGKIGRIRAEVVAGSAQSRVVLVADADVGRAQTLAGDVGCESAHDWQEVVKRSDVDIVIVSTPTKYHAEIAIAALDGGKHVLCEKPIALKTEEARNIVTAARRNGRKLKTGFNYRHMQHVRKAKEILDSGELGRLYYIRSRYGHGGRPGYDKEWYGISEMSGGGVLFEQGIHVVDLTRYFLGDPSRVVAETRRFFWDLQTTEDNAFCLFETPQGSVAALHVSWTQWINVFDFEIYGQDGYLKLEGRSGHYGSQRLIWGRRKANHSRPSEQIFDFPPTDDSWQTEWAEFLSAIQEDRDPCGDGMEGLKALRLVEAAYESARRGCWVETGLPFSS